MDAQTVGKLMEVIDTTAHYKALLLLSSYVRPSALVSEPDDLREQRAAAFRAMRVATQELERLLTLQVPV